jgi:Predicted integral membrane protein
MGNGAMWTRAEVKRRAWSGLGSYYWNGVVFGVLASLLGVLSVIPYLLGMLLMAVCVCLSPLAPFLSCIVEGFYADIIGIGTVNFYLNSIRERTAAPMSTMFSGFKSEQYGNAAKILIFRNVFQFLWGLLFVIPGVVKFYEYRMIPYLIAEYPEKGQDEIFRLSKQMMTGNKWKTFVFDLSFLGWHLLASVTCGLGYLFLLPYLNAACTELYLALKEERLGIPRDDGGYAPYQQNQYYQQDQHYQQDQQDQYYLPYQQADQGQLPQGSPVYPNSIPVIEASEDVPEYTVDMTQQTFPQTVQARALLVGVQGEYAGARFPIEPGEKLVVGRDSSRCNVILASKQVSRLHMTVEYVDGKFQVVDYSTYGTFELEQGRLPKEVQVSVMEGARLRLGNSDEVFRLEVES